MIKKVPIIDISGRKGVELWKGRNDVRSCWSLVKDTQLSKVWRHKEKEIEIIVRETSQETIHPFEVYYCNYEEHICRRIGGYDTMKEGIKEAKEYMGRFIK